MRALSSNAGSEPSSAASHSLPSHVANGGSGCEPFHVVEDADSGALSCQDPSPQSSEHDAASTMPPAPVQLPAPPGSVTHASKGPGRIAMFVEDSGQAYGDFPCRGVLAFVHEQIIKASRRPIVMPWETGLLPSVFGGSAEIFRLPEPSFEVPLGMFDSVSPRAKVPKVAGAASEYAKKRLRLANMIRTSDSLRWEALRKFKVLVMADPEISDLGVSLAANAAMLSDDKKVYESFTDVFSAKSTATLCKRSASLWAYAKWVMSAKGEGPLHATESAFYDYMLHLKSGAGAPSTGDSFCQAWNFLHHLMGMRTPPPSVLLSPRVKGAAKAMLSKKRRLVQASPLTVKMVKGLENVVLQAPYQHWVVIAGHLLFCLGSSCRFSDSLSLADLSCSTAGGITLLEAESAKFKTQGERRDVFLPLCCLGQFFASTPWADRWIQAREAAGLGLSPSLPAWSEATSEWLPRPMTTSEAALFLNEFLTSCGMARSEVDKISTHSLKCTVLSWAAKDGTMPLADRRLLGHHLDPSCTSPVTYGRDEMARLMRDVHHLVVRIRRGLFKPDKARVWRLAKLIEQSSGAALAEAEVDGDPFVQESEAEADDCQPVDAEGGATLPLMPRIAADLLPQGVECRVHLFSRVVHVLDGQKFECGRMSTRNYEKLDRSIPLCDLMVCQQCAQKL